MADKDLEGRIDELEARLAFQDDALARLNEALVMQDASIRRLQRALNRVVELLDERGADPEAAEETPPPHY